MKTKEKTNMSEVNEYKRALNLAAEKHPELSPMEQDLWATSYLKIKKSEPCKVRRDSEGYPLVKDQKVVTSSIPH